MVIKKNDRIFYACQAVIISPTGYDANAGTIMRGLQSIGMNSNFTLDQVFEMGQLEIYENIEDVADVEVSLEKVIDGETLIFMAASDGFCKTDLVAAVKNRSDVFVGIYDDATSNATGVARNVCYNSGMYISSVSYNYSVDGSATESVSLVGNERFWNTYDIGGSKTPAGQYGTPETAFGSDTPISGVVRRTDVDLSASTLPEIVESQKGDLTGGDNNFHIQSISVSADFGQENILELGRFGPYAKFVSFPIEVSSEFEVIATSGDLKSVSGSGPNLQNQPILITDSAGTVLDLGSKNKLSSISYSGGDTGGGNATITYSFTNFNNLLVDDGSGFTQVSGA